MTTVPHAMTGSWRRRSVSILLLLAVWRLPAQTAPAGSSAVDPPRFTPYASILKALDGVATGGVARILVLGDSRSVVDRTTSKTAAKVIAVDHGRRWADLLQASLQQKYGSHGTGLVPVFWGQGVGNLPNLDVYRTSARLGSDCALGPSVGPSQFCAVAVLPPGASITFRTGRIAYDHLRAYCERNATSGSLTAKVDGASVGTLCSGTTASASVSIGTSSAVPLKAHAPAKIECQRGSGPCLFYGFEGVAGTSGVSVDNLSVGGAALGAFASAPDTQFAFSDAIPEGDSLVIELHHTNEPGDGESTAQFQAELNTVITHESSLRTRPSIELVVLAQDNDNIAGQAPFLPLIEATAVARRVGYVDVRQTTGPAFNPFWFGPDGIHENSAGNLNNFLCITAPWAPDLPRPHGTTAILAHRAKPLPPQARTR